MLQGEHSAILMTFIKLPFVIEIFILSIFELLSLSCAGGILKNQPVCLGTSRLKSQICVNTLCALPEKVTSTEWQ